MESLGTFICKTIIFKKRPFYLFLSDLDDFYFSFSSPSSSFFFSFFACLIALTRTSSTMLIGIVRVGTLVLFLILEEKLSTFQAVALSFMAFIILRYVPAYTQMLRIFIMKDWYIFSNTFSALIEMIIWLLLFIL